MSTDELWGHHILCRKKYKSEIGGKYCSDCELIRQTIDWMYGKTGTHE